MTHHFVWLAWASPFLVSWLVLYLVNPGLRVAMLQASLVTALLGLTEPLFVPAYWNPPSLFELARRTGFDIESLIFAFAIGGIGTVLYDALTGRRRTPAGPAYRTSPRHRASLFSPFVVFVPLALLPWNPIYPALISVALARLPRPSVVRICGAGP